MRLNHPDWEPINTKTLYVDTNYAVYCDKIYINISSQQTEQTRYNDACSQLLSESDNDTTIAHVNGTHTHMVFVQSARVWKQWLDGFFSLSDYNWW